MAGKIDAELLKKHHFWVLLAPAALFVLLACIFVIADVAAETSTIDQKNQAEFKKLDQAKKSAKASVVKLNEQKKKLEEQQDKMWKQAWDEQAYLYTWPTGYSESPELEAVKKLPFGSSELDDRKYTVIRREFGQEPIYPAEYVNLAESLLPMQFVGGINTVLRTPIWTNLIPNSEDIWIALENFWVQREMLDRINQVNKNAARFVAVKDKPGTFRSPIWEVQLKVERKEGANAPKGAGNYLVGRIRNLSPRLQVFGIGNLLKLKIWFNDDTKPPFIFDIEGTSRPGDFNPEEDKPEKWFVIKTIDRHRLPVDLKPDSIFKVEQMFDIRTVPIKRVEAFAMGKDALGDRTSYLPLEMSRFSAKLVAAPPPASKDKSATPAKTATSPAPTPVTPTGPVGGADKAAAGSNTQYNFDRKRYVAVTKQVRRMPVAFAVVTDQSYMDEILESVANTKLRFQTTQCEWCRFHGTINYGNSTDNSGVGGRPGQATPTNNKDDQFSANLLELSVYGIISLYEKHGVKVPDPKSDPKKDTKTEPKEAKKDPKKK